MNPISIWKGLDRSDRYMIVSSVVAPILVWWFYTGRHKYSSKGMR